MELTIVILIVSMMMGVFGAMFLGYLRQSRVELTKARLDIVQEAIEQYFAMNDKLPCPAALNALPDSVGYGREVLTDCTAGNVAGTFRPVGTGGRRVRIGGVPVRSLNLPDQYALDARQTRFTYAVTEVLAQPGGYVQNLGSISLVDSAANSLITPAGSAHYVLLSHGQDQSGGYAIGGSIAIPCLAGTLDRENCDNDATFLSTLLVSDAAAGHFDDFVKYRGQTSPVSALPTGAVMAFNLASCPSGWAPLAGSAGRMVVGAGSYSENYNPGGRIPWNFANTYALGEQGGFATWRQNVGELATHNHVIKGDTEDYHLQGGNPWYDEGYSPTTTSSTFNTENTGSNTPQENRPPYLAFLYCQKT